MARRPATPASPARPGAKPYCAAAPVKEVGVPVDGVTGVTGVPPTTVPPGGAVPAGVVCKGVVATGAG